MQGSPSRRRRHSENRPLSLSYTHTNSFVFYAPVFHTWVLLECLNREGVESNG